MSKFGKALLAGAAGAALLLAPSAMAQTTIQSPGVVQTDAGAATQVDPVTGTIATTTVTTTTTLIGQQADISDPVAWLEEKGYSNAKQVPGVTLESQMAFHAANGMGEPVEIVMDRKTGEIVRETDLRKADTPSKR